MLSYLPSSSSACSLAALPLLWGVEREGKDLTLLVAPSWRRMQGMMNDARASLRKGSKEQNQRYHNYIEENRFIPEALLCSLLFTVLGIGYLLPWNAFLSATSYFNRRLCSSTSPFIQNQFEAIFGLVYNISATISLATMVMYLFYKDRNANDVFFDCLPPTFKDKTIPFNSMRFLCNFISVEEPMGLPHENNGTPLKRGTKDDFEILNSDFLPVSDSSSESENNGFSFPLILAECRPQNIHYETSGSQNSLINEDANTVDVDRDLKIPLINKYSSKANEFQEKQKQTNGLYVVLALSSYLFAFLVTLLLALLPEIAAVKFFFLTVASLVICGASSAVYTAEVLTFASRFPPAIGVKPYVSGQAFAGVITSLVKICLIFEDKDHVDRASDCTSKEIDYSALVFFSFASIVILCSMVSFYLLNKLPITKFYEERELFLNKTKSHQPLYEVCNNRDTQHYSYFDKEEREDFSAEIYFPVDDGMMHPNEQYLMDVGDEDVFFMNSKRPEVENQGKRETVDAASCSDKKLEHISVPALTCFVVLFATLSIFPSWTYQIQRLQWGEEHQSPPSGREEESTRDDFFFAELFFIFTLFDLIGRITSDMVSLDWACNSVRKLLTASYLRATLFVPLFLLCNHRRYNNGGMPALFLSNWVPVLLTALFAYSNGLLLSLTMIAWPCTMPKSSRNEGAAIISLACSLGLLLGSVFSFLLVKVGTGT